MSRDGNDYLAATITPQHLMFNRNDMLVGGIRPHLYCLPILKRNIHQQALRELVASGFTRAFLGRIQRRIHVIVKRPVAAALVVSTPPPPLAVMPPCLRK